MAQPTKKDPYLAPSSYQVGGKNRPAKVTTQGDTSAYLGKTYYPKPVESIKSFVDPVVASGATQKLDYNPGFDPNSPAEKARKFKEAAAAKKVLKKKNGGVIDSVLKKYKKK